MNKKDFFCLDSFALGIKTCSSFLHIPESFQADICNNESKLPYPPPLPKPKKDTSNTPIYITVQHLSALSNLGSPFLTICSMSSF